MTDEQGLSVQEIEQEAAAAALPRVAVVIVNLNGADHLRSCLDSLHAQDYPQERLEVVVVDNASRDESLELLRTVYPWVRVLPQSTNTGFAPAVNIGVNAVDADCVVLLNNDTLVDPDFVSQLVRAYDPSTGTVCVGAQILSWDGQRVDFVEGALNFYGMGQQLGYGKILAEADVEDGQELLFACGGAMLVERRVYLETGGLDDGFFAYFEDVDFGWRLWIHGYRVVLAADAKARHRMHGTSSRFPEHQRLLLYERNALRMIIKNYNDANLQRVLGPALLLLINRAVLRGNLPREPYHIGGETQPTETVSRSALAHLHAVNDVVGDIGDIMRRREHVQRARQRSDRDIVARFGRPFWPVHPDVRYLDASRAVITAFNVDEVFTKSHASRVLVVSMDGIAEKMSGPAIRALELAKGMAASAAVTMAVPQHSGVDVGDVRIATFSNPDELVGMAAAADIVLIQGYALARAPGLATVPSLLVVDLYDPWLFENVELHREEPQGDRALQADVAVLNGLLDHGDFFLCASERQRDYWLGMLASRDRLTQDYYQADPTLRLLIDVVPFGLPAHEPRHDQQVLKGVHPAISADDLVVLWGGGIWDWFDAVGTVEAFAAVVQKVPNAKLYFMGSQLPSANVKPMKGAEAARKRAEELGLAGTSVLFGEWVPYNLRESFLLESDVAVSAARELAETRLAFRTRVLDYLWAGLPVVTTEGDVLADLVRAEGAGVVVPAEDPPALAEALIQILLDADLRKRCAAQSRAVAPRFRWTEATAPLRRMIREPWRWESRRTRPRHRVLTEETRTLLAALQDPAATPGDVGHLRQQVDALQAYVAMQERRYDLLRRTPLYPAYKAARRARGWLARRRTDG